MQHITVISRNQMTFSSLEDTISEDNPIPFIDAFVENIDLRTLSFDVNWDLSATFLCEPENLIRLGIYQDHAYTFSRTRNDLHSRTPKNQ